MTEFSESLWIQSLALVWTVMGFPIVSKSLSKETGFYFFFPVSRHACFPQKQPPGFLRNLNLVYWSFSDK